MNIIHMRQKNNYVMYNYMMLQIDDANLFRFWSADATDAISPKIPFFHIASMLGLIYCNVCNLDFQKADANTKLQRMFSIYLTMTKTKTCTPKIG